MRQTFKTEMLVTGIATIMLASCTVTNTNQDSWAWTGFERLSDKPVLVPDTTVKFLCPMRGDSVGWMESDVFNPAAVVK